ncbi:MAG: hypothetical protein JXA69_08250 [Phycisphaerae bacterium]|nr:hypothetical protein [Phycisphaerae bacterium]
MESIIEYAFALTEAVGRLKEAARAYFYRVVLSGHACPHCEGGLAMIAESRARCSACGRECDPTVTFQRCACGGKPQPAIRRYRCCTCGADIQSRFLFDGLVFDTDYFRQKMTESRQRRHELRERVRQLLAGSRSGLADVPAVDIAGAADLMQALNTLACQTETQVWAPESERFDLSRYQSHIQAHLQPFPVSLRQIPPLGDNARKDLIWRFIAILFLAQAGLVEIWQDGREIMVMQRETDRERQDVPGDLEAVA